MVKWPLLIWILLPVLAAADPTRPPGWEETPVVTGQIPELQLQQIVHDGTSGVAVINQQLVRAGEQVEGMTVVAVQPDRVVLQIRNQRHELRLNQATDIKRKQP